MRIILSIALILGLALCVLVTFAASFPPFLETATPVDYVRQLFFAPGWFLLIAAFVVRLRARRHDRIFLFCFVGLPVMFMLNFAVAVVNAHAEGWIYWVVQVAYCSIVVALVRYSISPPAGHSHSTSLDDRRGD